MFAVGRLGSYISRGVNTVSGPFQGGAVDIIVVEQPDGSFKSSPWYVRVGKSQGALKVDERIVRINVNGVDADFCMYLDNKGDAVFLCQVEDGEGESEIYPSSGDDLDPKSELWRNPKSKSCNFDANRTDLVEFEASKGKIVPRTNSPRARYLEHAEMAANLLEVRWTTNLASSNSNIASNASDSQKSKEIYEDFRCSINPGHMDASSVQETYNGAEIFPHSSENASCNGKEKSSCNAAKVQLQDNIGRHPVRSGSEECLGDCSRARNASVRPTEISEDEQFSFSDLDEPNDEKVKGKEGLVSDGWKECLTIDLWKSSDEQLTETVTKDDELIHTTAEVKHNSTSSPISISKAYKNVDLEFCPPIVESLPNLPFAGDNINPDGIPDLLSRSLDSNFEALKMVDNDVQMLSELGSKQQVAPVQPKTNGSHISEEIKKIISDPAVEVSLCRHLLHEGMGYEAAALAFDSEKLVVQRFSSLCPDIVKDDNLVVRIGGLYFPWDAALPIASTIGSNEREHILEPKGMIAVGQSDKTSPVVPQKSVNTRNGSWKIWPFSFRRSHSVEDKNLGPETASQNPSQKDGSEEVAGFGVMKKKKRAKAPTSEQLLSLNLKEGKNVVTFTVSTATQGNQQVDARIFLWNWNSRIVISDVDGTITKSDVLGQFMPLMGYDWSQTGVTRLFSAIKENGYYLLFLSARSILQAYHTRQFLVNLTQDGKALPEGPVVISPDGIFPSLYREVIRRAPHEFKIACLEDIRALFPQDHNPFYAGFGNRDTDEFSYLKVGIPRGKIFTINPKGQIVVNRRVDTKSYTSLHELVHDMFPPAPATEQEDYNNWNFWRLPPPDVGI